jgi:glutaredoxin
LNVLQAGIAFGLVSAIDGGFSGDWSANGLISKDAEMLIRSSVTSVGEFHLVCPAFVAFITSKRAQPVAPAVLKTLLVGGLAAFQASVQTNETAIRFPSVEGSVDALSKASQKGALASFKQYVASSIAGKYDEAEVKQSILSEVNKSPVVMYSFTTCPYCIKAKKLLIEDLGVKNLKVIELDIDREVGFPIRAELGKLTGRTSVPSVWVGGNFIGGCGDGPTMIEKAGIMETKGGLVALQAEGQLVTMLSKAGALKKSKANMFSFMKR